MLRNRGGGHGSSEEEALWGEVGSCDITTLRGILHDF